MSEQPIRRRLASRLLPAFAGLASVLLGVGVAELVAAIAAPSASPVLVVGSLMIDWAPAWAKETAIALFGTGDKAALLTGIAIVLAIVSGAAGVLEQLKPPFGLLLFGAAGVFGAGAALTRSGSSPVDIVPVAAATILAIVGLGFLLRKLDERPRPRPIDPASLRATAGGSSPATAATEAAAASRADAARLSRRRFLGLSAGAVVIGALSALGGYALEAGTRATTAARNALKLPAAAVKAAPVPAGAELDVPGLAKVVTPNAGFYRIDTALQIPQIDPNQWTLKVTGMVENPVTVTFAELLVFPLEESYTTLMCVSDEVGGDLIGNAKWLGYPIRNLLARAKPKSSADMVFSRSSDGFTASTPLSVLQDDRNAILAVGMNDEPLPLEHGYPVRMVVPGLYGYVSATKWVVELEVSRFADHSAYWTQRGWSPHGPVKIESRIDVPRDGLSVPPGTVVVAGVAWHQHTGIQSVEVRVDGGAWSQAELATAISADTWVQWKWEWDAPAGNHRLEVRATDLHGMVQTAERVGTVPDGATGYHRISVRVG